MSLLTFSLCVLQMLHALRPVSLCIAPIARWFLLANATMLLLLFVFKAMGYPVFVILVPRVIHDVTVYLVCAVHYRNRNRRNTVKVFYRLPLVRHLPQVWMLPLLSVLIAGSLTACQGHPAVPALALYLCFFHHHSEGLLWRSPSLHWANMPFRY